MKRSKVAMVGGVVLVAVVSILCAGAAHRPDRWEYCYVYATPEERGPIETDIAEGMRVVMAKLNSRGAEGWELVGVAPNMLCKPFQAAYMFKRKVR